MDPIEDNQEVNTIPQRGMQGSSEEAANKILGMWDSQEQTANEETKTTDDESVVEEETEAQAEVEEAEVETNEDSEEEKASEEVEEVGEEEEDTEVVNEEDLRYTIKVDGEELEVSIDELRNGYQRQADYTRKSQALAEQRKETENIQSERMQLDQERQMYANGLRMLQEQQQAKLSEFDGVDWTNLKEEDPHAYIIKKDEFRDAQERLASAEEQQYYIRQEQEATTNKLKAEYVQQEYTKLSQILPEWNSKDSTIKQDIRKYATEVGFLPQEIDQLADHRSVLILKKAMEYDRLTEKLVPKKKAVKKVPKVQKPGRGKQKSEAADEQAAKKRTRLRKSGRQEDAASIFYDML
jgi:hypothetical protein